MINLVTQNIKLIVSIFLVLTIIKLFTAAIYGQREDDPAFCLKIFPTIENIFDGHDDNVARYRSQHSWYKNQQYWILFRGNDNILIEYVYFIMILSWWFMSAILIVVGIKKIWDTLIV